MKVKEFLNYCEKRNLSSLTVRNYRQHLKDYYVFLGGRVDIDESTPNDLLEFVSEQRESVSAKSVNIKMASLRVYFDFVCRFYGLPKIRAFQLPNVEKRRNFHVTFHKRKWITYSLICPNLLLSNFEQRQSLLSFT